MTKLSRNDPCACGSGKKYKKCCLVSIEGADFQYRRLRQIEAGLIPRLLEHAFETFGDGCIVDAWDEFNDAGSVDEYDPESDDNFYEEHDPASPMNMVFMPWFLFNWTTFATTDAGGSMPFETTVAESFMQTHRSRLSLDEVILLSGSNRCPFTFCEVVEARPGVGMKQFDLLRRLEYEVIEHTASQTLKRGDIIYCATTRIGEVTSNIATGPYALRPTAKRDVLELRKWMLADSKSDEITNLLLEFYEADIRDLYLDYARQMLNPHPRIRNTDNDPMLPQKVYFDIESSEQAFHALKDLAEGVEESELLADAEIEEGRMLSAEIPWLGGSSEARKRLGGAVLLGNIKIDNRRIIVDVNSNERAELIRLKIEKRLGGAATYRTTLIEPLDLVGAQRAAAAAAGHANSPGIEDQGREAFGNEDSYNSSAFSLSDAPPELLARVEEMNREHWNAWFDLPIPALNDLSPREASETEEGRDLLDSLLLEYERYQNDSPENIIKPDIAALRRKSKLK